MENEGSQPDAPPSTGTASFLEKITRLLKLVVFSMLGGGLVVLGGLIGWQYITDDHNLRGEVSYQYLEGGQGYYLIVSNQDSGSWTTTTVIVNDKFKFKSQDLSGGETYHFDLTQFVGDGGARFLPENMTLSKVRIESGWDSAVWTFGDQSAINATSTSESTPTTGGSPSGTWKLWRFSGLDADQIDMTGVFKTNGRTFTVSMNVADEDVRLAGTLSAQGNQSYELTYDTGATTTIQFSEDLSIFRIDVGGQEAVFAR